MFIVNEGPTGGQLTYIREELGKVAGSQDPSGVEEEGVFDMYVC